MISFQRTTAGTTIAVLMLVFGFSACDTSPKSKEARYLHRGSRLSEKKDYSRAVLEFKNASAVMPADAEPFYRLGMVYLDMGDLSAAIGALRKATELNPHHAQAELKLAELMARARSMQFVQEAAGRLEGVISSSPGNAEASEALALVEWRLGKTADAVSRLEETLRKMPSRLETSLELAELKVRENKLAEAEGILKSAVERLPLSAEVELALGQIYLLENDRMRAERELLRALQLNPRNAGAMLGIAAVQIAANRMQEAEEMYRELSLLPGFKPLHALFLYRYGKREAAIAELEKQVKEVPDDRGARNRLFAAYRAIGRGQAALELVAAALKKNPQDVDALFQRAELRAETGDIAGAEQDVKSSLHFQPNAAKVHFLLAEVYKEQGRTLLAQQELHEALRLDPELLRARLALARMFTLAKDSKAALDVLEGAPPGQKANLAVTVERNWALLSLGDIKGLRASLDRGLAVQRLPELLIQDSLLRMQQRDYAGARADAEECIRTEPRDVRAARLLVQSYIAQKQPEKAEERLRELVAAQPGSAPLAQLLGEWYADHQNQGLARKMFDAAEAVDPKFLPGSFSLAELDAREMHPEAAKQRLLRVLALDPKNVRALLMLGSLADKRGDRVEAIARYEAVLEIDRSSVSALNNLAYALAFSDPDQALKYAQQAGELAPDNPVVQDTLGWVFYRKGFYDSAVRHLKASVSKDPTPRRQYHLGMSYLKSGDRDLGSKMLQSALREEPELTKSEIGW